MPTLISAASRYRMTGADRWWVRQGQLLSPEWDRDFAPFLSTVQLQVVNTIYPEGSWSHLEWHEKAQGESERFEGGRQRAGA